MLLATGSEVTTVTPEVAQRLGMDVFEVGGRKETLIGIGGDHQAGLARVSRIDVGEAMVPNILVGVPFPDAHDPRTNNAPVAEAEAHERPVDGVLGYSFLRQFRVTIDYPAAKVVLEPL